MQKEAKYQPKMLNYAYEEYSKRGRTLQNLKIDKYVIYDLIGRGSFGEVYRGMDDQTKKQVAIKLIDMKLINQCQSQKLKQIKLRLAESEPRLMMMCNSPFLLKCYNVYENPNMKILILQFCNGKTLQKQIDEKGKITQSQAIIILRHIINGLIELHKHKIVHRDLKAENIMSHNGTYKIIDFGFSKKLEISMESLEVKGTALGTITTMAPEVMSKKPYGLKADIWSLGIIFFQMIFGIYPYDSIQAQEMYRQIRNKKVLSGPIPPTYNKYTPSQQAYQFLKFIIVVETDKRPNWKQVSDHPLIKKINDEILNQRFLNQCEVVIDQKLNCDEVIPEISSFSIKIEQNKNEQEPSRQFYEAKESEYRKLIEEEEALQQKCNQEIQKNKKKQKDELKNKEEEQRSFAEQTKKDKQSNADKNKTSIGGSAEKKSKFNLSEQIEKQKLRKKQQQEQKEREEILQQQKQKELQRQRIKLYQKRREAQKLMELEKRQAKQLQQAKKLKLLGQTVFKIENGQKKSANYLKVNQIRPIQVDNKKIQDKQRQMDKGQSQQYAWTQQVHLQCLKTQLIFRQIINPLEVGNILDFSQRQTIEFLYLLIARCFNNMSPVQYELQTRKKNKELIQNLNEQITPLYIEVRQKFLYFSAQLTAQQDKKLNMVKDFFSKAFKKQSFSKKDKFLVGIQNIQYLKRDQIEYTYQYYIDNIQKQIKPNVAAIKKRLAKYIQINNITLDMCTKRKTNFNNLVKDILSS